MKWVVMVFGMLAGAWVAFVGAAISDASSSQSFDMRFVRLLANATGKSDMSFQLMLLDQIGNILYFIAALALAGAILVIRFGRLAAWLFGAALAIPIVVMFVMTIAPLEARINYAAFIAGPIVLPLVLSLFVPYRRGAVVVADAGAPATTEEGAAGLPRFDRRWLALGGVPVLGLLAYTCSQPSTNDGLEDGSERGVVGSTDSGTGTEGSSSRFGCGGPPLETAVDGADGALPERDGAVGVGFKGSPGTARPAKSDLPAPGNNPVGEPPHPEPTVAAGIMAEKDVVALIEGYYRDLNAGTLDAGNYFGPSIQRYISMLNTSPQAINTYIHGLFKKQFYQPRFDYEPGTLEQEGGGSYTFAEKSSYYLVAKKRQVSQRYRVRIRVVGGKMVFFQQFQKLPNQP